MILCLFRPGAPWARGAALESLLEISAIHLNSHGAFFQLFLVGDGAFFPFFWWVMVPSFHFLGGCSHGTPLGFGLGIDSGP